MPRVIRSCALLGYVVTAGSVTGYVIVKSYLDQTVKFDNIVLLAVAVLGYIKAASLFQRYQPTSNHVMELTCAIHAEVCRHIGNGQRHLQTRVAANQTANFYVRVQNGAAVVDCTYVGGCDARSYSNLGIEPTGAIFSRGECESWHNNPLVPQLKALLHELRNSVPCLEKVYHEDH